MSESTKFYALAAAFGGLVIFRLVLGLNTTIGVLTTILFGLTAIAYIYRGYRSQTRA